MAERSKVWVCGRPLAGIVGSNAVGDMDVCLLCELCFDRYIFLGRLITRPEESYRLWCV